MTRILLTLAVVACYLLAASGMWWGWRNRRRRQARYLPSLPEPPAGAAGQPLLPDLRGVYLGTTTAGDWQDRIVAGGLGPRATATMRLTETGLLVDRAGAGPLWIPPGSLLDARTDRACAGRVVGNDRVLVVRWLLGGRALDSGLISMDTDDYPAWCSALRSLAARMRTASPADVPEGSPS